MSDSSAVAAVCSVYVAGGVMPGPDFVAVVHRAASGVRAESFALVAGIAIFNLFWASCEILGVGFVFAVFPWLAALVRAPARPISARPRRRRETCGSPDRVAGAAGVPDQCVVVVHVEAHVDGLSTCSSGSTSGTRCKSGGARRGRTFARCAAGQATSAFGGQMAYFRQFQRLIEMVKRFLADLCFNATHIA
ncbi:hypothetical protein WL18_05455 [Burkholderia ubonensis]|nr:hypothetical protein WL18_05455 [Burkholderia ubonensis]